MLHDAQEKPNNRGQLDAGAIPDPEWLHGGALEMPNLSIKDVPEELADALRQRAARNHRSLQGELMAIIQQAAQADGGARQARGAPSFEGRRGTRTIEDFARESRVLYPEPLSGGPLAVDIIRADRDSR
jgi:antitoxin FitA